ncbi:MAG TPA: hypothetical protein VEI97_08850, partial [bacterium]|nr:hypothetical protein [bacterium]
MTMPSLRTLFGLTLLCALLAALPASYAQGTDKKDLEAIEAQKQREKAALEQQKRTTQQRLSEKRRERKSVTSELNAIDDDLLQARGRLESLRDRLSRQQHEMARMRAQYDRSQMEYEAAQARLSSRLRTWYKSKQSPVVAVFFNPKGPTDLAYRLRYAEAALASDRATLAL